MHVSSLAGTHEAGVSRFASRYMTTTKLDVKRVSQYLGIRSESQRDRVMSGRLSCIYEGGCMNADTLAPNKEAVYAIRHVKYGI